MDAFGVVWYLLLLKNNKKNCQCVIEISSIMVVIDYIFMLPIYFLNSGGGGTFHNY